MDTVRPEAVGLSSRRLQRLDAMLQRYIDNGKLAGTITLLARDGQAAYFRCQGVMDMADARPMQPDALFRIFSMSKPITSAAVLMLYEDGYFHLTDPVANFIPAFSDVKVYVGQNGGELQVEDPRRGITVHDLLTHTAGLCYGLDPVTPVDVLYGQGGFLRVDEALSDKIPRLAKLPLMYHPGTTWHYSMATDTLGYLVEVVSGMPLDRFFKQRIFDPLGMADTAFYVPADKLSRLAEVYVPLENGTIAPWGTHLEFHTDWKKSPHPPAFSSGGGGLISTASDYLRFAQMLRNGGELDGERLLGRKTVELMTMNQLPAGMHPFDDPAFGFGLGVGVQLDVAGAKRLGSVGAYGWGGAASTDYWYDPEEDLIAILMVQLLSSNLPLSQDFRRAVLQAIVD